MVGQCITLWVVLISVWKSVQPFHYFDVNFRKWVGTGFFLMTNVLLFFVEQPSYPVYSDTMFASFAVIFGIPAKCSNKKRLTYSCFLLSTEKNRKIVNNCRKSKMPEKRLKNVQKLFFFAKTLFFGKKIRKQVRISLSFWLFWNIFAAWNIYGKK